MLIYDYFEGDDLTLAMRQHDAYGAAFSVIVSRSKEHVALACSVLDVGMEEFWRSDDRIDHRTLQVAHDILAAAWRYAVSPPQHSLFATPPAEIATWLTWLRQEVGHWSTSPAIVAAVRRVVWFQNSAMGYAAEDDLRRALLERHQAVPWCPGVASRRQ